MEDLLACFRPAPVGGDRFEVGTPDWWTHGRVFGGMVVAQALGAALQTVDLPQPGRPGKALHSLHGYFLRPSPPARPVEVSVDRVRDGRAFSLRRTTSRVDGQDVFSMQCSFHVPEEGDVYQLPMPAGIPEPESIVPSDLAAPFDIREVGPTPRRTDGSHRSTRRAWLRTTTPMPDDPRLHACVIAYISDMTAAAFRPHSLGVWGTHTDASLDHAVWFHRPARADEWLYFDLHALVNDGGRATVRGELYGRDGRLRASMAQEILIRPLANPVPERVPGWAEPRA